MIPVKKVFWFALILILNSCTKEESPFSFPLAGQHKINELKLINAFEEFTKVEGALSLIVCRNGVIDAMTTTRISTNNDILYGPEYGYQIWLGNASGHRYYMAMGWGGQFIFIVPDKELVVTATCRTSDITYQQAGDHWTRIIRIIVEKILPAIE